MTAHRWVPLALAVSLLAACDPSASPPSPPPTSDAASPGTPGTTVSVDLDKRPFRLHVPRDYDPAAKVPLVVLLHGYRANSGLQETYFKLTAESDRRGFLYAMPDGTQDRNGNRFWNATDACCDLFGTGVDDATYLSRLVATVTATYAVDPARVYLIGHSNGGFMAHRMACEHAGDITAIVSLAGAAPASSSKCRPERPVSVLQIHGTDDRTIRYGGGEIAGDRYPSVAATLATWRRLDGCASRADTRAKPLDLVTGLAGRETSITTYATGCREGTRVELWSIRGGSHVPAFTPAFAPAVMDFLFARRSPTT